MMETPKAVSFTRADQLRQYWRQVRHSWLIRLAGTRNDEDRFPLISDAERSFVQRVRLERLA